MPMYEFLCENCHKRFEQTYSLKEYERERKRMRCPKCDSSRVVRQISAFEVKTSKKS